MKCPFCNGTIPLADPRGQTTTCTTCEREFIEVDDLGWWGYSIEVYKPVEEL